MDRLGHRKPRRSHYRAEAGALRNIPRSRFQWSSQNLFHHTPLSPLLPHNTNPPSSTLSLPFLPPSPSSYFVVELFCLSTFFIQHPADGNRVIPWVRVTPPLFRLAGTRIGTIGTTRNHSRHVVGSRASVRPNLRISMAHLRR